ncbi:MAG: DUF45 domain-containing protein [Bacteroidales bacterium]|nr:DUF45 domain-containing protein [Bacteroidales bacterium]
MLITLLADCLRKIVFLRMVKKYLHPQFGEIKLVRSSRSRKISITLKPFHHIRVSVPQWVSYQQAITTLEKRNGWVLHNLQKIREIENKQTIFLAENPYKTRYHQIKFAPGPVNVVKALNNSGKINITFPERMDIRNMEIQQFIRKVIEETYRFEAKKYIPARVFKLAKTHGYSFGKITIRNSKTRWGSCSHKNNLSFSLHIMRLPDKLIDFIILHELAHTRVKNHSCHFWEELNRVSGDAKGLTKEIRKYRISVY